MTDQRGLASDDDWKCAGCGKPYPNRRGSCDCPTGVVYRKGESAWKVMENDFNSEAVKCALRRLIHDIDVAFPGNKWTTAAHRVLNGGAHD